MTSVIEFASQHPITTGVILIALVAALCVFFFKRPRRAVAPHLDFEVRSKESPTDPLTFWRNEIRSIAEKYGSPVKAANQLKREMDALDFNSLNDNELEALQKYWREVSNWCGRVRIELHKLNSNQSWHPNAWTQLFNVFGEMNLRVKIAWSERTRKRTRA